MFCICTIPPAFRRASVWACLVSFASLQSPWAHTLKASLPCLLLPLHRASQSPQPSQKHINRFAPRPCLPSKKGRCYHPKKFVRLPEGLLPIRTINEIFRTIPCPAPYPCLPCQRRTSVARKKFGRLPEGLLPICTNPPKPALFLENRSHPRLLMNVPFVLHLHYPTGFS